MPLKPCLGVHGSPCNKLTRGSRCPDHQAEIDRRREASRPSWVKRYGKDWQSIAKRVVREERACVLCGQDSSYDEAGEYNPLTAGHIISRKCDGTNERENMQCECRRCNSSKRCECPNCTPRKAAP